jgi:transcriptional regulator GlxA family with amidase domain
MRPPKPRRIVIAAYEGVSLLDLAGPLEAFQVASSFGGSRDSRVTYECSVVSIRGGPVKTANGVELVTKSVRSLGRDPIDTLIVPGAFLVDDVTRDRDLVRWVGKKAETCSVRAGQGLAGAHFRWSRMRALARMRSFLMMATIATLAGPALTMASYLALNSGFNRMALRAGM